jgi:hypothetical protein
VATILDEKCPLHGHNLVDILLPLADFYGRTLFEDFLRYLQNLLYLKNRLYGATALTKWLAFLLLIIVPCFTSCSPSDTSDITEGQILESDNRTVLINRLRGEKLPALKSIETWQSDYGPGLKLTTAHYEIFTTVLEPLMLRRIPGFMESAYRGYNEQLPRPVKTTKKLKVYLFDDREQWESFTNSFAGDQASLFCKIKAGAYYLNGACVTYNIGSKRTFSAIGHEGWHQFNSRHFKYRLPSWLDEGIAMLFEISTYKDGMFYFEPAKNSHRLYALREILIQRNHIPLQDLLVMSPGEVLAIDQAEAVSAFYSQSYALIRFLQEADEGQRLANYRMLLWDGLRGDWLLSGNCRKIAADRNMPRTIEWNQVVGLQLFKDYIADDIERIEREYLTFCRKIARE